MQNEKRKGGKYLARPKVKTPGAIFALPFFIALFVLTAVAYMIPLRPTVSMNEKRNLAEFPEFSVDALVSGDYFDDITLWFSDTFPGRDSWISVSTQFQELHGFNDVVIYGELSNQETVPGEYSGLEETRPTQDGTDPEGTQNTEETTEVTEGTVPTDPVEVWGGVNAGEGAEIYLGNVIQIGDTAFNYFGFSQNESDRFINTMTWLNDDLSSREGLRIATALIPTSVGILVEKEYQEKIGCVDQEQVIDYIFSGMPEEIIQVDVFDTLIEHNDEYIYFRTDHHWTALGGYYCYVEVCKALGMEAASLDSFEVWEQGTFIGSNYYKCNQSNKLRLDTVTAYNPPGDITMIINNNQTGRFSWPVLTDMSNSAENSKYMVFLAGDHALCEITNNDLPDAPNCVIVKDSYGNCVAPFFTQNYHNVYVIDFREYRTMNLREFINAYDIDDVIFLVQAAAAQDRTYNNLIRTTCGY